MKLKISAVIAILLIQASTNAQVRTASNENANTAQQLLAADTRDAWILPVTRKEGEVLSVKPDHPYWTYKLGASATMLISFNVKPYPAEGIKIQYKLGPEMREGADKEAVVPSGGLLLPVASPKEPGFIRCIVNAKIDGKPVREVATVGFSPEKITPTQTEPADFDAYWAEQKAELAKIPPDYQLTPAPQLSTPNVEVFYLSFQNIGNYLGYGRFYGVLAVPRGAGPYPAVLNVPGAGVRPYYGNIKLAEHGVITLQVGVHGIPVNLIPELYDELDRGALKDYPRYNLDDRFNYFYRRVHLGVLRAADYLTTLPKWDHKNLMVAGNSQGGQLSIMTAALEPRITALAANYPAYSDVSGYLRGRTGG